MSSFRLLTVGSTVDEAAFLFQSLEKACQMQLMVEAAAANGIPKSIIPDDIARATAIASQSPVCLISQLIKSGCQIYSLMLVISSSFSNSMLSI